MKKASEEIFYQEAGMHECEPKDREFRKRKDEYCERYEQLQATLNEEQKKSLDRLYMSGAGVREMAENLYFREGLLLGLRLGFEACSDADLWKDSEE